MWWVLSERDDAVVRDEELGLACRENVYVDSQCIGFFVQVEQRVLQLSRPGGEAQKNAILQVCLV